MQCQGSLTPSQLNSIRKKAALTKKKGPAVRPAKHGRREGRGYSF